MRKIQWILWTCLISAFLLNPPAVYAADREVKVDTNALANGKVSVGCASGSDKALKVMIEKGEKKYTYNLKNDGTMESFPLQMGDGDYRISVLENVEGTSYRYLSKQTLNIKLSNPDSVFLNSIQNIRWDLGNKAIQKDRELIGKEKSYEKKVNIIYDFLVKKFTYDYEKLKNLKTDYLPDIDRTLQERKGICYDYASLFAAMKRSEGVPTKLVKGYATKVDGYHAWNEIRINGKWVIIDTTYDSSMNKSKVKYVMIKNPKEYKKVNEY